MRHGRVSFLPLFLVLAGYGGCLIGDDFTKVGAPAQSDAGAAGGTGGSGGVPSGGSAGSDASSGGASATGGAGHGGRRRRHRWTALSVPRHEL
ncbi:MAG: hypothetical protein U0263_06050 [Polyangiaceae bacterium]